MNIFELTRILNEMKSNNEEITNVETAVKYGNQIKNKVSQFIGTNTQSIKNATKREDKRKVGGWMKEKLDNVNDYMSKSIEVANEWSEKFIKRYNIISKSVMAELDKLSDEQKTQVLNYVDTHKDELNFVWNDFENNIKAGGGAILNLNELPEYNTMTQIFKTIYSAKDYQSNQRIGRGEILLCLLFNGQLINNQGDIRINGNVYEVKSDKGAFADGNVPETELDNYLSKGLIFMSNIYKAVYVNSLETIDKAGLELIHPDMTSTVDQSKKWRIRNKATRTTI